MKTIFVDPGCCANAVPWQWHKLARHTVLGHSQGLRVGLQVFGPKVLARGRGAKRSHTGFSCTAKKSNPRDGRVRGGLTGAGSK